MAKAIPNGAYKTEVSARRAAHKNYCGDCATFYCYETVYGWGWFASDSVVADEWRKTGTWYELTDNGPPRAITGPHQFEYAGP